jgi:nucleoside diphosphate kinase
MRQGAGLYISLIQMQPIKERTIVFVKPHCDKSQALEIINLLEDKLRLKGEFERVLGIRTGCIPKEFWLEFYQHIEAKYPVPYEKMCSEFANKNIAMFIYEGENIIQRTRDAAGPTFYKDNIGQNTIRELFADPCISYRNAMHASDSSRGFDSDFAIFKRRGIIPESCLEKLK